MIQVELKFERVTTNKLNEDKLSEISKEIARAYENRGGTNGITTMVSKKIVPVEIPDGYKYSFVVAVTREKYRSENAAKKSIELAVKYITRAAEVRQWKILGENKDVEEKRVAAEYRKSMTVEVLDVKAMKKYFGDIYERDSHIRLIHASVQTAVETKFNERNHLLLYGKPAAAKTVLFRRLKDWYESSDKVERVWNINSTTLSKAGLETLILDKAESGLLPEIMFFDEIEKCKMEDLSCLLGIMDEQATISRTNSKIGQRSATAKCLIWATCNDIEKLKEFNRGALFSRFTKALPCVRPCKELMLEIMLKRLEGREKQGIIVNKAWAKAAVDYAFDIQKCNDPRKIASLLDGRDGLLNGSYFKDLQAIEDAFKLDQNSNLN